MTSRLDKVDAMLADAIDNVRRFSRDLRPSLLDDLGLVHAIDWLVGDLHARTGIETHLSVRGAERRLDASDELALFRIVQEALRNVEHHSAAKTVKVRIAFGPRVRTTVLDDGCGFDPGMRERANLAGAQLEIRSRYRVRRPRPATEARTARPDAGTRVAISLDSPA